MANLDGHRKIRFRAIFLVFFLYSWDSACAQIRYSVSEEQKHGTFVGNIANDLGLYVGNLSTRMLRMVSSAREQYFKVDLRTGILLVDKQIDRELLCAQSVACSLTLELVVQNPLEVFHANIDILDINDNAPSFENSQQHLEILESAAAGTRFLLESAHDLDVGSNSLRTYALSPTEYFTLDVQSSVDNKKFAELVLEKHLDREKNAVYNLVLTAIDGGTPERSGTSRIVISVLDVNDNVPVFDKPIYQVTLVENAPVGTLVIKLNATDIDEGRNGDIVYKLHSHTSEKVRELFSVQPQTGEIRVKGVIDFEEVAFVEINIEAKDKGPYAVPVRCKVIVNIVNVNDNAPEFTVSLFSSPVPEDAPLGTMIALISLTDHESEENGGIQCYIPDRTPFLLKLSSKNSYTLVTHQLLDRETAPQYTFVVTCRDSGTPPLSSNKSFLVEVSDINDNAPHFTQSSYTAHVMENSAPGSSICTLTAFDADLGVNAYVSYSVLENHIQGMPMSSYVSIGSESGIVFSNMPFDYEQIKSFQFIVQATDAGIPPLSDNVTVNVIILDQNDNTPEIVSPLRMRGLEVTVPRSADPGYLVTKVIAVDADSGQNARLSYQLPEVKETPLFRVGLNSGEVRTARRVGDRDAIVHRLVVVVKDQGHPPLSASVIINLSLLEDLAQNVSDVNLLTRKSEYTSNIAFYLIIFLGTLSSVLFVTIIFLVFTICQADRNAAQGSFNTSFIARRYTNDLFLDSNINLHTLPDSKQLTNVVEVRGTGSLSRTYCYQVHSTPDSIQSKAIIPSSRNSTVSRKYDKDSDQHEIEWNEGRKNIKIEFPVKVSFFF